MYQVVRLTRYSESPYWASITLSKNANPQRTVKLRRVEARSLRDEVPLCAWLLHMPPEHLRPGTVIDPRKVAFDLIQIDRLEKACARARLELMAYEARATTRRRIAGSLASDPRWCAMRRACVATQLRRQAYQPVAIAAAGAGRATPIDRETELRDAEPVMQIEADHAGEAPRPPQIGAQIAPISV